MTTLRVIARSTPTPWGALALACYLNDALAPDTIKVEFVLAIDGGHAAELVLDGARFVGQEAILEELVTKYKSVGVAGTTAREADEIATLRSSFPAHPPAFGPSSAFLDALDTRLTLRTFLVGHTLTVADWATWGLFKINTVLMAGIKKGKHVHAARWYSNLDSHPAAVVAVSSLLVGSKMKAPPKAADGGAQKVNATFELGLPNAIKGHVVTRFPPEPSGYLHIGHAKAAILNQYFAKLYEGKFLIRFDDTNPSKEKAEFEESIVEDLALLGVKGDYVTHTSDYFDELHQYCMTMLKEGNAYADDTIQEKMRDERMNGIPSERRDLSPAECLEKFAEMATGSEEGQRWCIRAKISFDNPNKAMRDPVIYRGNALPHHRTGDKYKVYPTYDFACPIVDCLEGVTHALRTNEYRDRNPQYQWMLDALALRKVEVWDFGRVNFVYTLLSKRKLKWFVDEGHVRGWDDPRFPTVRGIRRRGMTIEALTQYMLIQGPSQAQTNLEWDSIWSTNKKVIDPVAPRFVALERAGLVKVTLSGTGCPSHAEQRQMPRHKKNDAVGLKTTVYDSVIYIEQVDARTLALGEELTLMDWGNAFVASITPSPSDPATIASIDMTLNLDGDFKKTKLKLTWLSAPHAAAAVSSLTPVVLLDYDYLITKKKLEEDDSIDSVINPVTEYSTLAWSDSNVAQLHKGDIVQFERKGYYVVDKPAGAASGLLDGPEGVARVECIYIPDGRAASIALKYDPSTAALVKSINKPLPLLPVSRIPEPAPLVAQTTVLRSEGAAGFEIPILTKMFRVGNVYGDDGVEAKATTKMFDVKPFY